MLLTLLRRGRDDEGSAIVAVLGLMLVLAAVAVTIVASSVSATGFTTATRASVQARAAALAGIDAARTGLSLSTCAANNGVYAGSAGTGGTYSAAVFVPNGLGGWAAGCPTSASQSVRVVGTGSAAAKGVAGNTAGDTASTEAILGPGSVQGVKPSGSAIYAYSSLNFAGSGTLKGANGSLPDVVLKTGDVNCSGGSSGANNIVAGSGAVTIGGSCNVAGNVFSTKSVSLSGNVIVGGSAVAPTVSVPNGTLGGNVFSSGATSVSGGGKVVGGVYAGSLADSSSIGGDAWITGATNLSGGSIGGRLTTQSLTGTGTIGGGAPTIVPAGPGPSSVVPPTAPSAPGWIDYAYQPSMWTGFQYSALVGLCTPAMFQAAVTAAGTNPLVIDATGCTNGLTLTGTSTFNIAADTVIFANVVNLSGSSGSGSITSPSTARLWIINPDVVPDGLPTCGLGESFSVGGGFTESPSISMMMYSPCFISLASGLNLVGQVYAGQATVSGGATLTYAPLGLPGTDLSAGTTSTSGAAVVRQVVSMRSISAGG